MKSSTWFPRKTIRSRSSRPNGSAASWRGTTGPPAWGRDIATDRRLSEVRSWKVTESNRLGVNFRDLLAGSRRGVVCGIKPWERKLIVVIPWHGLYWVCVLALRRNQKPTKMDRLETIGFRHANRSSTANRGRRATRTVLQPPNGQRIAAK